MKTLLSRITCRVLQLGLGLALPLVSQADEILVHDDFQNNVDSQELDGAITSDELWTWSLHESSGSPLIHENEGNLFASFYSELVYSMTLENQNTGDWLTLDTAKPFEIEFDYLYLTTWSDHQWFDTDYLLEDRYVNMGATNTTDPAGYRLRLKVASDTELQYRLIHKAQGDWSVVPGSEGSYQTSGLLNPDSDVPGNPVRVVLRVLGNQQQLFLDGNEMFDLDISPHPQNSEFMEDSYLQFWSNSGRRRGFDNVTIRELSPPAVEVVPGDLYWSNANTVRTADLDGTDPRTAGIGADRAIGVALDATNSHLYWAEDAGGRIVRTGLDGSGREEIVTLEFVGDAPESGQFMAVDSARGKLYWSEWRKGLFSSDLDGGNVQQLIELQDYGHDSGSATVTVDHLTGQVYWGIASTGEIVRVEPDGSAPETIATLGSNTYGTAVDGEEGRLYYTSFGEGTLGYYDFDTETTTTLLEGLGEPLGIAINEAGDQLYWVERTDGLVRTAGLIPEGIETPNTLVSGEDSPFGIAVLGTAQAGGFDSWIADSGLPEELQGPEVDAFGDGLPNLVKYALGIDPSVPATDGRPEVTRETIEGSDYLTLTAPRNVDAVGVNLLIEVSDDLVNWEVEDQRVTIFDGDPEELKVGLPLEGEGRLFLRLRADLE